MAIEEGGRSDPRLAALLPAFQQLVEAASSASTAARAPYSRYPVGAAVLDDVGRTSVGCNVESAAFGATICAERVALGAAVAAGAGAIVACVTVARDGSPASCCGVCRQLLAEFGPEVLVVNASLASDRVRWGRAADWLPFGFTGASLEGPGSATS